MARIGKRSLEIPKGTEVKVGSDQISVKGPKGTLTLAYDPAITIEVKDNRVLTIYKGNDRNLLAKQGLYNSMLKNAMVGLTTGFEKKLELVGVGYRAAKQGKSLSLAMGYSHPVVINPPEGIEIVVEGTNKVIVKGADRQVVGQIAAEIREVRKVEPYKGKGIRYEGEKVRRKAGKTAKAATAA